jgi:hypothetical protein
LPEIIREERVKAEQIARRWLGEETSPLRDSKGRKLLLVMDRFTVSEPDAVRQVHSLGKAEQESVLFFDGGQWIGEADFSVPGEMSLVTASKDAADRLLALMRPIDGLVYQERRMDDLSALDQQPGSGGADLLEFKKTFFAAWLDEPNQKLEQATPREASVSPRQRPLLHRLLTELESKEARLPRSERFSFAALRAELGL